MEGGMLRINRIAFFVAAFLAAGLLLAKPAAAHGRFGVFFGFAPVVVGPPVYYYPPPVYYYPPAYYAPAPAATSAAPAGFTCVATPYVCPLTVIHPVGGPCECPAYGGAAVAGTVR